MSIYLGNTPLANTGYDKANTDLSNLNSTGKNIANWSDNVTNCITEIPQDIKLEIDSNGKAVLKAGSKVYIPNGFTGTTQNFDVVTIASDVTYNFLSSNNGKFLLANQNNGQAGGWAKVDSAGSGTSTESTTSFYYRTDDNKVYYKNNSSGNIFSLPLAIVDLTNGVATIDQVFNGFGYIGSTVFALPGVKGLIPNGRNEDGSLKNIEFINPVVRTYTVSGTYTFKLALAINGVGVYSYAYDEIKNAIYRTDTGAYYNADRYIVGDISYTNGVITSLTPKTAFHAVDYNDSSIISGWSMPSSRYIDLTLGADGSTYTAPANGWFVFGKRCSAVGQFFNVTYVSPLSSPFWSDDGGAGLGNICGHLVPVTKGQIVRISYNTAGATIVCRFIYAEGDN